MKIFSIKGMFAVALINVIILNENICLYSLSRKGVLDANVKPLMPGKALIAGKEMTENVKFSRVMLFSLYIANTFALFLIILLSGDVHPNPGPSFNHSNESLSSCNSVHYFYQYFSFRLTQRQSLIR